MAFPLISISELPRRKFVAEFSFQDDRKLNQAEFEESVPR